MRHTEYIIDFDDITARKESHNSEHVGKNSFFKFHNMFPCWNIWIHNGLFSIMMYNMQGNFIKNAHLSGDWVLFITQFSLIYITFTLQFSDMILSNLYIYMSHNTWTKIIENLKNKCYTLNRSKCWILIIILVVLYSSHKFLPPFFLHLFHVFSPTNLAIHIYLSSYVSSYCSSTILIAILCILSNFSTCYFLCRDYTTSAYSSFGLVIVVIIFIIISLYRKSKAIRIFLSILNQAWQVESHLPYALLHIQWEWTKEQLVAWVSAGLSSSMVMSLVMSICIGLTFLENFANISLISAYLIALWHFL